MGFKDIFKVVEGTIQKHTPVYNPSLEDILEADRWARELAAN
ncbi:MAG: hypothetical protein ACE5JL_07255 [Dehalococcoidia bacterium]